MMRVRSVCKKFLLVGLAGLMTACLQAVEVFPPAEVRPGLRGVGRTCIAGTELTEFPFEVLGVVKNVVPGRTMAIVRLSGPVVEKTGVFSGMSGSPLYIDGKLLGALAYSFPYSKEPIAGVTLFAETRDMVTGESGAARGAAVPARIEPPTADNLLGLLARNMPGHPAGSPAAPAADAPAGSWPGAAFQPIRTPLTVSGAGAAGLGAFRDALAPLGFEVMAGGVEATGGSAGTAGPIVPGSSVAVSMIRGDVSMGAGGTVTEVDGKKVYAFGHPFVSSGSAEYSLHASEVIAVVPLLSTSFKFFTTGAPVGVIRQDRVLGVSGVLGETPRMIPVTLTVKNSRDRKKKYSFEVARDRQLTPLLLNLALGSLLSTEERQLGWETIAVSAEIHIGGGDVIPLRNVYSQANIAPALAAAYVAIPVQYLMLYDFPDIDIESVSVTAEMNETLTATRLDEVWVSRTEVRPGDDVGFTVGLLRPDGSVARESFSVKIPENTPPGPLLAYIGDGTSLTQLEQQLDPAQFVITASRQLVKVLKQFRQDGTLYLRLYRKDSGFLLNGREYPSAPSSVQSIFRGSTVRGGPTPVSYAPYIERTLGDRPYPISGFRTLALWVEQQ